MFNQLTHTFGMTRTVLAAGILVFSVGFLSLLFAISELGIKALLLGILVILLGGTAYFFNEYKRSD